MRPEVARLDMVTADDLGGQTFLFAQDLPEYSIDHHLPTARSAPRITTLPRFQEMLAYAATGHGVAVGALRSNSSTHARTWPAYPSTAAPPSTMPWSGASTTSALSPPPSSATPLHQRGVNRTSTSPAPTSPSRQQAAQTHTVRRYWPATPHRQVIK